MRHRSGGGCGRCAGGRDADLTSARRRRSVAGRHFETVVQLGLERTFERDPKYAVRLLVDIAIKALSPAVNDPTTAVQALDQIEDVLIRSARRRLEIGAFRDGQGRLRVLVPLPVSEDFLELAFDEIRYYGATGVQVMRCMKALVSEMLAIMPEERRPALHYGEEGPQATVQRDFSDREDVPEASHGDRQGLGSSRRRNSDNSN